MAKKTEKTRYWARYLGGGFVPGIPARDLTADEVEQYDIEDLKRSGRYEILEVDDGHEGTK